MKSIKKILIKIALLFLEGLILFKKLVLFILNILIFKPFLGISKLLLPVIVKIYKYYLPIKSRLKATFLPQKHKILTILSNRYTAIAVMIIITFFVSAENISARGNVRSDIYGQKSILFSMTVEEDSEILIEEKATKPSENIAINAPTSYLGNQAFSSIKAQTKENSIANKVNGSQVINTTTAIASPSIINTKKLQQKTESTEYIVKQGDTISDIAEEFDVSTNTILWDNDLTYYSQLKIGQKLSILPVSGVSHTIKTGETISSIANKYDTEPEKIVDFNRLSDANDISKGQTIIIPDGTKRVAVAYTPTRTSYSQNVYIPPSKTVNAGVNMVWPTPGRKINQYYHWRHKGIDIDGVSTDPIYAAADGVVEISGWQTGYGYTILLNHGNGLKTRYGHFSKLFVSKGDTVQKGQTLGLMGTTGWSTGVHLHFEIIKSGVKYNPFNYVQ